MAVRSLTDVFMLMRNNAIQNRNFYNDQVFLFSHNYEKLDSK